MAVQPDNAGPSATVPPFWVRHRAWIIVGLALLLVLAVRVRLREMPFERDEGEYAYAGQLILKGIPPYKEVFNMKLPGTYAAYAAIMAVFGESTSAVHLGVALVNCASIVLVFLIGRKILDRTAAVTAALAFALMSLSPQILGLAGHATHFVTLFALAGIYFLLKGTDSGKLWPMLAAGTCFGLAFLMKQHGVFFIVFALVYVGWLIVRQRQLKRDLEFKNRLGWARAGGSSNPGPRSAKPTPPPPTTAALNPKPAASPSAAPRLSHFAAGKLKAQSPIESVPTGGSRGEEPQTPSSQDPVKVLESAQELQTSFAPSGPRREDAPAVPERGSIPAATDPQASVTGPGAEAPAVNLKRDTAGEQAVAQARQKIMHLGLHWAALGGAVLLPYLLTCLILWLAGVFPEFWFWTMSYASTYATSMPFEQGLRLFRTALQVVAGPDLPLWLLPWAGALFMWWDKRVSLNTRVFLVVLLLCSIGSVCVGFYFREHYFIPLLPVLGWLSGLAVSRGLYLFRHDRSIELFLAIPVVLLLVGGIGASLIGNGRVWFGMTPPQATRYVYGSTLFAETINAARFIQENSPEQARVAILGSEPQILFHARRRSATGFIYMYPLMEEHRYAAKMQTNMIRQIEKIKPEYVVFINDRYSWLPRTGSPQHFDPWWNAYWRANLDLVMSYNVEQGLEQLSSVPILGQKVVKGQFDGPSQIMIFRAKK